MHFENKVKISNYDLLCYTSLIICDL